MIVIDASIANKIFLLNEKGRQGARSIFRKHTSGEEEILIPDFIFLEVANTLVTKIYIPKSKIFKAVNQLYSYNLKIHHPDIDDIKLAASFAQKYKTSVYDAIYAVLALENKCDLITADEKFVDQVKLPFVKKLSQYPEVLI